MGRKLHQAEGVSAAVNAHRSISRRARYGTEQKDWRHAMHIASGERRNAVHRQEMAVRSGPLLVWGPTSAARVGISHDHPSRSPGDKRTRAGRQRQRVQDEEEGAPAEVLALH